MFVRLLTRNDETVPDVDAQSVLYLLDGAECVARLDGPVTVAEVNYVMEESYGVYKGTALKCDEQYYITEEQADDLNNKFELYFEDVGWEA